MSLNLYKMLEKSEKIKFPLLPPQAAMSALEFGELINKSVRTLQRYDKSGKFKARRTAGNDVFYLPEDVQKYYQMEPDND